MLRKIYWSVRLLPKKGREPYVSFYKILNFYPHDIALYQQALLHKSSSVKLKGGRWVNNERLEFLGDAILDAIVADVVFKEFETKKEGFLTNIRSRIVQRETLNKLAIEIGIDKLIKTSARTTAPNTHMYGNALEALIGAIYLDRGYRVAKKFVQERLILEHLNMDDVAKEEVNFKSKLIEWGQKHKVNITFELLDSFVDENNTPTFKSVAFIHGEESGHGEGFSKKESQQRAAEIAVHKLKTDIEFQDRLRAKVAAEQEAEAAKTANEEEKSV